MTGAVRRALAARRAAPRVPGRVIAAAGYDCHRDHGAYAGVAELLGGIAVAHPGLAARHRVELHAIVPHLDRSSTRTPITETIRFHPARRTASLAYGATEFVAAWAGRLRSPATVRFDNVDRADDTTRDLLDRLAVRVGSLPLRLDLRDGGTPAPSAPRTPEDLRETVGDSLQRGFYGHAARVARHGRTLVTSDGDLPNWWAFTTGLATALAALGEAREALDLYRQARDATDDPQITMSGAYATAMLHARHLPPADQDPERARHWLGVALRLVDGIPDPRRRVLSAVFYEQGIALLDSRAGHPERALRVIDDGLTRLAAVLGPGDRRADRARLLHNRAQVWLAMDDHGRALADLEAVIAYDPDNCEYYMDRAAMHRAAGRVRAAIRDYGTAIRLGPHLPEAYYNRATLRHEHGRPGPARDDLQQVVAIEPGHVEARVALANLHLEGGDAASAERCARAGLELAPRDPELLCTLGLACAEAERPAEAENLLSRALAGNPGLVEAWTNRAAVRFERGDAAGALADLDRAVALSPEPVPRYNRGLALGRLARWDEAAADFADALTRPGLDRALRRDLRTELARARRAARVRGRTATGPRS